MSTTDTQDIFPGADAITDDNVSFNQKMHPDVFPYEYKVIEEREFLVPSYDDDGRVTITEKGCEWLNTKWERRPCYVVEMTQLDKSYIYSKRLYHVDKETFMFQGAQFFDQKGKLYRTYDCFRHWIPEAGYFPVNRVIQKDHVDSHTTLLQMYISPNASSGREPSQIYDLMGTK